MAPEQVLHRVFKAASHGHPKALSLVGDHPGLHKAFTRWAYLQDLDVNAEARIRWGDVVYQMSRIREDFKALEKVQGDLFGSSFLRELSRLIEDSRKVEQTAQALRGFLI